MKKGVEEMRKSFQFHNGTIKTLEARAKAEAAQHFNSIMVQLKLFIVIRTVVCSKFQFHNGTIKTLIVDT